jgi:hypothetical protein
MRLFGGGLLGGRVRFSEGLVSCGLFLLLLRSNIFRGFCEYLLVEFEGDFHHQNV